MTIRKLYLDMDGVLADFERGVIEPAGVQPTAHRPRTGDAAAAE